MSGPLTLSQIQRSQLVLLTVGLTAMALASLMPGDQWSLVIGGAVAAGGCAGRLLSQTGTGQALALCVMGAVGLVLMVLQPGSQVLLSALSSAALAWGMISLHRLAGTR